MYFMKKAVAETYPVSKEQQFYAYVLIYLAPPF